MRDGLVTLPEMADGRPAVEDTAAGALFADVERRLFGSTERAPTPKTIGRYQVTGLVGSGANGVVYRARDPALDREVAVKVLRADVRLPAEARDRMRREARALAALSHPSVVDLYDAGVHEHAVFVVMELVDGEELGAWLQHRRPGWRQILGVFAQIADGLAAAHERDIIHRDIKPANILVDSTGRPRVADFGLAAITEAIPTSDVVSGEHDVSACPDITRTGLVVGTPAYMAPEQHESRQRLGVAADQFSFCVALWEALYGTRPFTGRDWVDLLSAKRRGPPSCPGQPRVPSAVRRVLERGLAREPGDRFGSMAEVAKALRGATAHRSLHVVVAGGLAVVAGAAAWMVFTAPDACTVAADQAHRDWEERAAKVRRSFDATALPYAGDTFERVDPELQAWASEWKVGYEQACRADHEGRAEGGAAMRCLQGIYADYTSVTGLLEEADPAFVLSAVQAVQGLPAPRDCAAAGGEDEDGEDDPDYAAIRSRLRMAKELGAAGLLDEAGALLREVRADAKSRGSPRARLALQLEEARLGLRRDPTSPEARERLEAVAWDAVAAGRDDAAVDAMLLLADWIRRGVEGAGAEESDRWLRAAEARLGAEAPVAQRVHWQTVAASNAVHRGDLDEARAHAQTVLDLPEDVLPRDSLRRTNALASLAMAAALDGDADRAYALYEQVLQISREALGPNHPIVAGDLVNLGRAAAELDRLDEARTLYEAALAILEPMHGSQAVDIGLIYDNLGNLHIMAGRLDEAEAEYGRAHELYLQRLGPDHPRTAVAHTNVAYVATVRGDHEAAIPVYRDAIAIFARDGQEPAFLATNLNRLGGSLSHLGRLDEAEAAFTEARDLLEERHMESPDLGRAWAGLARVAELREDAEAALSAREKVVELRRGSPPMLRATAAVNLAIALKRVGRMAEARTQAKEAIELLGKPETMQGRDALAAAQRLLEGLDE